MPAPAPAASSPSTINIQPADPQVVYVPTYNPTTTYGTWAYPASPPVYYPPPPMYYPGSALVAGLAARIDALPDVAPLPVPAGELLAWLDAQGEQNQSRDPEREAQWLLQAHAELPDDEALAEMAASALNACGAQPEARALLWRFVRSHAQNDGPAAYTLMRWLAEQGDDDGLRQLARLRLVLHKGATAKLHVEHEHVDTLGEFLRERQHGDLHRRDRERQSQQRARLAVGPYAHEDRSYCRASGHRKDTLQPLIVPERQRCGACAGHRRIRQLENPGVAVLLQIHSQRHGTHAVATGRALPHPNRYRKLKSARIYRGESYWCRYTRSDFGGNHMVGALVNVAENLSFPNKKENTQILAFPEGCPIPTLDQHSFFVEPPTGGLGTYLSCSYVRLFFYSVRI